MGLFSKKDKIKDTDTSIPVQVNFQDGSNMIAVNPQITAGRVTHRDGKQYALMMFEVSNLAPDGGTIYVTNMNKIIVEKELNPDGTCSPLTREEMYTYSVQYIDQVKAGLHNDGKVCKYIGRLPEGSKQMVISPVVQDMVDKQIEPPIVADIHARNEQKRIEAEAREAQQRVEFLAKAQAQSREFYARETQKKQARLQAERFDKIRSDKNSEDRPIEDYDGVDIATGDVLRVRGLCKQGKDRDGIYLYTAGVSTTHNEDDVEIITVPGKEVAFTTPIKIDQLLQTQQGKRKVLELFARANQVGKYNDGITFVGNLDMNGTIYNPYITNCSEDIQNEFDRLNQQVLDRQERARQRYQSVLNRGNEKRASGAVVTPLKSEGKKQEEDREIG